MKPLVTIAALALAFSAFAQGTPTQTPANTKTTTIKIKSKGDDVRTVIDSIFEQAGKQYVLETNFHQSVYMNLDNATFEKAIEIMSSVADLDIQERQGIWYIRTKTPTGKTPVTTDGTTTTTAKAAAKKPGKKVATKTTKKSLLKKTAAKKSVAAESFAEITEDTTTPAVKPANTVDLTPKLTLQLKKMDIREVFGEMTQQTRIEIEIDDAVPNYKLDAYFYNTSLKFALDKICKIAGLKYTFTPSKTVRISKA